MKEKYSSPVIVNAEVVEGKEGAFSFIAAIGAVAGYAVGRAVTNAVKASPSSKLPSLKMFRSDDNDFCMA